MRIFPILFLLCSLISTAQITYYELPDGKILDFFSFEKHKNNLSDGLVLYKTISERKAHDSIIKKVTFNIVASNPDSSYYDPFAVHKKKIGEVFPLDLLDDKTAAMIQSGKPVLINYWFTSCRPCVMEIPILNELASEFKDQAQFVAITFDRSARVQQFLTRRDFNFHHQTDARPAIDKMGVAAFPMNVLLDKNGVIQQVYGDVFAERYNLSARIRELVNE